MAGTGSPAALAAVIQAWKGVFSIAAPMKTPPT
jgi:hypothetical protein